MTAYVMQYSHSYHVGHKKQITSIHLGYKPWSFLLIIGFDVLFLKQAHKVQADLEIMMFLPSNPNAGMTGFNIMLSLCRGLVNVEPLLY